VGSLGLPELIVVLVIVIIIFGANRLPKLGQGIGHAIKNFKNATADQDEPPEPPAASQLTCEKCATVNPADSRFCRKCGQAL
jgi:sec-independent protein translocase protein TatA